VLLDFHLKCLDHDRLQRGDYLGALSISQLVKLTCLGSIYPPQISVQTFTKEHLTAARFATKALQGGPQPTFSLF
jgi:hypothetical protein